MGLSLPGTGQPAYRLLAQSLREKILNEEYAEDEAMPTELVLADRYSLSRQTVRRAYLELVTEGLVDRVPGRGTFVTSARSRYGRPFASVRDLMNLTLDTELELVSPIIGTYDPAVAERLQLTGRSMYWLLFRRLHHGDIFCATDVYLPPAIGAPLEEVPSLLEEGRLSRDTVIGLIESGGTTIAGAEQTITAVAAPERAANLLNTSVGSPLLHIERLYFDDAERPVELAVSDYLPEHYAHRLRLSRGSLVSPENHKNPSPRKE